MGPHVCPWWFAYTFDNPLRTLFHNPERIFAPYVHKGMTVADIGCGFGYFSIGLAKMTKGNGKVIAIDIQSKMLEKSKKRAHKADVSDIIQFQLCTEHDIGIEEPIDFALAFWMVHETTDIANFLRQIHAVLKPTGLLLVTEPKFHVSFSEFKQEILIAQNVGFRVKGEPTIKFSFSAVFEKDNKNTTANIDQQ